MPFTYTPLRYPGGKTKLYGEIKPLLTMLDKEVTYVEPFAGGAGLALKLLFCNDVKTIILNDIDKNVFLFWNACLEQTDDLCKLIYNANLTINEWDKHRFVIEHPNLFSDLERAFSLFYLNRCNRSGIIKGGPIGGRDQSGEYKIDARFNKEGLIKKIKNIGNRRHQISVYCMDGKRFIQEICARLPRDNTLVYIDPPYVNKGPVLYQNSFTREDHVNLSRIIQRLEQGWVVTYDADDLIKALYSKYSVRDIWLGYSAGNNRTTGHEYIITNIMHGERELCFE